MKNSVIRKIEGASFCLLREEYLAICRHEVITGGVSKMKTSECAAALLALYEHRHNSELDVRGENQSRRPVKMKASNSYLVSCLLGAFSPNSIRNANNLLQAMGYISIEMDNNFNTENMPNTVTLNVDNVNDAIETYFKFKVGSSKNTYFKFEGGATSNLKGGYFKFEDIIIKRKISNNDKGNTTPKIEKPKKPDPLSDPMIDLVIDAWNEITGQDIQKTTMTHRKNIATRLKENPSLTLEDFRLVIAGKFKEWNKEPEAGRTDSRAWITTNTILGSKFDGYLNSLRMLQKRQIEIDRRAQEDEVPLAEDLMARAGWKP